MAISHRLKSPMFDRPDDGINQSPKRIVFLSVEGNVTEVNYFNFINKYRNQLNIESVVHIETLSRGSNTASDPSSVLSLLEEFLEIRSNGITGEVTTTQLLSNMDGASVCPESFHFPDIRNVSG